MKSLPRNAQLHSEFCIQFYRDGRLYTQILGITVGPCHSLGLLSTGSATTIQDWVPSLLICIPAKAPHRSSLVLFQSGLNPAVRVGLFKCKSERVTPLLRILQRLCFFTSSGNFPPRFTAKSFTSQVCSEISFYRENLTRNHIKYRNGINNEKSSHKEHCRSRQCHWWILSNIERKNIINPS